MNKAIDLLSDAIKHLNSNPNSTTAKHLIKEALNEVEN